VRELKAGARRRWQRRGIFQQKNTCDRFPDTLRCFRQAHLAVAAIQAAVAANRNVMTGGAMVLRRFSCLLLKTPTAKFFRAIGLVEVAVNHPRIVMFFDSEIHCVCMRIAEFSTGALGIVAALFEN